MKNKKLLVLLATAISLGGASLFANAKKVSVAEAGKIGKDDFDPGTGGGDGGGNTTPTYPSESEPNNYLANANDMMQGRPKNTDFSKTFNGSTIGTDSCDFYSFTLFGNANVEIRLTDLFPNADLDLELYECTRTMHEERDAYQALHENIYSTPKLIGKSAKGSGKGEYISINLKPNVYYVKVFDFANSGDSPYKVSVSVTYSQSLNYRISDLKRSYTSALWYSDYNPFGLRPNEKYKNLSDTTDSFIDHNNSGLAFDSPFYRFLSQGSRIKNAALYVWDEGMIKVIRDIALINAAAYRAIEEAQTKKYNRNQFAQAILGYIGAAKTTLTVLCINEGIAAATADATYTIGEALSAGISAYSSVAEAAFGGIFGSLIIAEVRWLITAIIEIDNAIRTYEINDAANRITFYDSVVAQCDVALANLNRNPVLRIEYYYRIVTDSRIPYGYQYKFDASVNDVYVSYYTDYVYSSQSNTFINGRIYPITTFDNLEATFKRR